jgi:hypothetical protein
MRATAAEAIVRGTIFLLSFMDLADEISVSYDRFRRPFTCATATFAVSAHFILGTFGLFTKTFPVGSPFLFFNTCMETGTGRGP